MHGTMDYFSKFYNKTPVVASVASEKTDEVEPPQGPCSTTQPTQATTHNKTPVKVDPNSTIEQELPPESDEPVTLWETKIRKSVLPCKLVWAPFYRFKGQRFCARICENDEIERDLYIQTPILDHEIVVEFIRAPKTKRLDTKLLKVEKNKLLPYYGKLDNNDAVEADHWNEGLVEKMHKAIKDRFNVANAEHICTEITKGSEEYLRESLKFQSDLRVANIHHPLLYTSSPLPAPKKAASTPAVISSDPLFDFSSFTRTSTNDSTAHETLSVGDHICYASEINSDTIVHTRVLGFSENPAAPLVLENGGFLPLRKRVRKLETASTTLCISEHDLHSGHYRTLSDYVLCRETVAAQACNTDATVSVGSFNEPVTSSGGGKKGKVSVRGATSPITTQTHSSTTAIPSVCDAPSSGAKMQRGSGTPLQADNPASVAVSAAVICSMPSRSSRPKSGDPAVAASSSLPCAQASSQTSKEMYWSDPAVSSQASSLSVTDSAASCGSQIDTSGSSVQPLEVTQETVSAKKTTRKRGCGVQSPAADHVTATSTSTVGEVCTTSHSETKHSTARSSPRSAVKTPRRSSASVLDAVDVPAVTVVTTTPTVSTDNGAKSRESSSKKRSGESDKDSIARKVTKR